MASAPRPGNSKNGAVKQLGFRITVRGESAELRLGDIGPRDDAMLRRATKDPAALDAKVSLFGAIQQLADGEQIGSDTLCVLHWFGRRKSGDTNESLSEALDRWPSMGELGDDGVLVVEAIEDDGEDEAPDPLSSVAP